MNPADTVLILQHQDDAPSGNLLDWLQDSAIDYRVVDATDDVPEPVGYRAVVCLGSRESTFDDTLPWVARERVFLEATAAVGTPIFGICFGAQQLATISGGSVSRMQHPERGWVTVTGEDDFEGRWFAWHQDEITPGADSVVLARSGMSVQAFRTGPHIGVQFHPEITPERVRDWMSQSRRVDAVTAAGSSPADLLAETEAVKDVARAEAFALYAALLSDNVRPPRSTE